MKNGTVIALSKSTKHSLSKFNCTELQLLKGLGVEGDAHMGKTVKHRSRVAKDPSQANLRQVHLIHSELHKELASKGFTISYGEMGENISTKGIELLNLPKGTRLTIGESIIEITGLRNPCHQLNSLQEGLMNALLGKDENGNLIRKAGVMGIIIESGQITIGDEIRVQLPPKPFIKLDRV